MMECEQRVLWHCDIALLKGCEGVVYAYGAEMSIGVAAKCIRAILLAHTNGIVVQPALGVDDSVANLGDGGGSVSSKCRASLTRHGHLRQ